VYYENPFRRNESSGKILIKVSDSASKYPDIDVLSFADFNLYDVLKRDTKTKPTG
jgi:hypothetical protein